MMPPIVLLAEDDPLAKCGPPPKGVNSRKLPGAVKPRRVGGVMTYECKPKYPYAVGGASELTCQEDGTYSANPLECSSKWELGGMGNGGRMEGLRGGSTLDGFTEYKYY